MGVMMRIQAWLLARWTESSTKRNLVLLPFALASVYYSIWERDTHLATELIGVGAALKALLGSVQADSPDRGSDG
jgi:hypothetical protein